MAKNRQRSHTTFRFKRFEISNSRSAQRVGTDGVITGAAAPVESESPVEIWDAGAGTGLIALMLAQRNPLAHITAIEIDPEAASECRANVAASPWPDRVDVVCDDIGVIAPSLPRPDIIVSNPPFFASGDSGTPDARRALARHDGTLGPLTLISLAARSLNPGGRLTFIAPYDRNDSIMFHASLERMQPVATLDIASRENREPIRRLWTMMRRDDAAMRPCMSGRLDIHPSATPATYTEAYRQLTGDFYLDF